MVNVVEAEVLRSITDEELVATLLAFVEEQLNVLGEVEP